MLTPGCYTLRNNSENRLSKPTLSTLQTLCSEHQPAGCSITDLCRGGSFQQVEFDWRTGNAALPTTTLSFPTQRALWSKTTSVLGICH